MARYKRYFPVSHEINHDPEVLELVKRFGAPGLQLWLEILSITDKTENVLKVSDYWLVKVSQLVCCRFATGLQTLNYVITKGWLEPNKPFTKGSEVTYNLPNYAEYHRMRSVNSNKLDSQSKQISVPPNLPLPSLPNLPLLKKEVKKEEDKRIEDQNPQNGAVAQTAKKALMKSLAEKPETVSQETWDGFMDLRNKKGFPFTVAALKSTEREAEKVGYSLEEALLTCQRRGWRGFEARYVQSKLEEFI